MLSCLQGFWPAGPKDTREDCYCKMQSPGDGAEGLLLNSVMLWAGPTHGCWTAALVLSTLGPWLLSSLPRSAGCTGVSLLCGLSGPGLARGALTTCRGACIAWRPAAALRVGVWTRHFHTSAEGLLPTLRSLCCSMRTGHPTRARSGALGQAP